MKRHMLLTIAALLTLTCALITETAVFAQSNPTNNNENETFEGWKVNNNGGYYSESDGTIRIWSDTQDQGVKLYKEIAPTSDSEFSLQVKANSMDGFGIFIAKDPLLNSKNGEGNGPRDGITFEFHNKYGTNTFLLARSVNEVLWATGVYGTYWDWQGFAYGEEGVWYTMKLQVKADPFTVSGQVFNENGVLLGKLSLSDMVDFTFSDIQCIGFTNGWGGDYSIRNISDVTTISGDGSSGGNLQAQISITPEVPATTLGTPLNIKGKLVNANGEALANEIVVLSYSFPGIDGWLPISSSYTDASGEYMIQWVNTATGYFALKAQWDGNASYSGCSNSTNVNILPYKADRVFFVQSNSTVTALAFNSTTSTLVFSVTGPTGTHGYTQVIMDKNLISNIEDFQAFIDGKQLSHTVTPLDDSWLITIYYTHSTHEISMQLQPTQAENSQNQNQWLLIAAACIAAIVVVAAVTILKRKQALNPVNH